MSSTSRAQSRIKIIQSRPFSSSSSSQISLYRSKVKLLTPSGSHPTPSEFYRSYVETEKPGLFPKLVHPSKYNPHSWTSINSWSRIDENENETLDGMRNPETEALIVPVEIGKPNRGYMEGQVDFEKGKTQRDGSPGWDSIQMPFGLFLDAFIARRIPWSQESQNLIGYMAQHDLVSQSPILAHQCPSLPYTSSGPRGELSNFRSNTWVGPKDSFTPIHRDPYHNLFVQVVGEKRFHIFPPSCEPHLSLNKIGKQQNTSTIASEDPLLENGDSSTLEESTEKSTLSQSISNFDLSKAIHHPSSYSCILSPGDALFLPIGYFHCLFETLFTHRPRM